VRNCLGDDVFDPGTESGGPFVAQFRDGVASLFRPD
jgi:hypothetical protein